MALARNRRNDRGIDYWPGFVDALSTLILGIIFLLSVFVVVQFFLSQEVTGKDTALNRLNVQIAQLTELLSLERTGKVTVEEQLAQLRANLSATEGERDRYKGLYEGLGSGAATAAMANLAEAIHGLVSHMRTEQQMIRDWADNQAAQGREVQRLLERIAGEEPRKDELRKTVR